MIRNSEHRAPVIYFSQWSRKGYAVFAALGKEVAFATVSINICERALLKSAKKGVVIEEMDDAKECVLREKAMRSTTETGYRRQAGEVCADANGMEDKIECTMIRRYVPVGRTSFLCGKR